MAYFSQPAHRGPARRAGPLPVVVLGRGLDTFDAIRVPGVLAAVAQRKAPACSILRASSRIRATRWAERAGRAAARDLDRRARRSAASRCIAAYSGPGAQRRFRGYRGPGRARAAASPQPDDGPRADRSAPSITDGECLATLARTHCGKDLSMKVNDTRYRSIWLGSDGRTVRIIDQTRLPHDFRSVDLTRQWKRRQPRSATCGCAARP